MRAILITLISFVCLFHFSFAQTTDYTTYELEDVSIYRQQFDFQMPAVPVTTTPVPVAEYESLENQYFSDGRKVYIEADSRLASLIRAHKAIGEQVKVVPGYRIQIFAGSSREGAQRVKGRFLSNYPGMGSYLTHTAPTYRIRVGDFLERSDALKMLAQLKSLFPDAFVVADNIPTSNFQRQNTSEGGN